MSAPLDSPYTPGETTLFLPGRDAHTMRMRTQMQRLAETGEMIARVAVFVGGRGVGKTSLLRYGERTAAERGLTPLWLTAGDSELVPALGAELETLSAGWSDTVRRELTALVRATEVTLKVPSVEVKTTLKGQAPAPPSVAPGKALERLLTRAAQGAREHGQGGLVLFIDELQSADLSGLRALSYAWQQLQARKADVPAAWYCAGLGHTSDVLTDAASFTERFEYQRLRDLSVEAQHQAILDPADRLGVTWRTDAVDLLLERALGYPYFLQLCANAAWNCAQPTAGGEITAGHVASSEDDVEEELERFYRTRWSKATPSERELLRAVALSPDEQPRRGDVAARMGRTTQAISMARRSLLDKGILDSPRRGVLTFTAPGFAHYILDEDGLDD